MTLPFVSVVTPTYNRRKFIPLAINIYKEFDYPKEYMEWIILDDGTDKIEDLIIDAQKDIPNIRYYYEPQKKLIGAKRNKLNSLAKGDIIISMDDDDYYPPQRIKTIVSSFKRYSNVELAGSSELYLYYIDTKEIYNLAPFHHNHATNGTMAWRKSYTNQRKYDEYVTHAEEVSFLENYKNQMIQLDPKDSILVLCHSDNTFNKNILRENSKSGKPHSRIKKTEFELKDFIIGKNKDKIIDFIKSLK